MHKPAVTIQLAPQFQNLTTPLVNSQYVRELNSSSARHEHIVSK